MNMIYSNIFQNLMSLLTGPSHDTDKPRIHAVRALADYVVCLRCRIKCYQDPSLYTPKQGRSVDQKLTRTFEQYAASVETMSMMYSVW